MKRINKWIDKNIINLILVFIFLQPIIDVATAFSLNVFHVSITPGIIIRMLFLLFLGYYFLVIEKSSTKNKTLLYLIIIILYCISFIIYVFFDKGSTALLYEMQGLMRTFYFPIALILLISIFQTKNETIEEKVYSRIMIIYVILIVIPYFTNTSFDAYTQGKIGTVGWFHSTNEISTILSMLLPFGVIALNSKNNTLKQLMIKIVAFIGVIFALFMLGTKMTIISLGVVILVFGIAYLVDLIKKKKYKIMISIGAIAILIVAIGILLIPKTSFYKNIKIHMNFLGVNSFVYIVTKPEILDHFVFSQRLSFWKTTRSNYQKAPLMSKLLGVGYIENYGTDEVNLKLIEMDGLDIFYRHGIIGFIIYFLPLIYYIVLIIRKTLQKKQTLSNVSFYTSIGLCLFMSMFVGHVVVAPAVSIFIAVILANRYQLTRLI